MLDQPEPWLAELQQRWLRSCSAMARTAYTVLYVVNRVLMRLLFRVSVEGLRHLPVAGPFIVRPNHASPLDPPVSCADPVLTGGRQHRSDRHGKIVADTAESRNLCMRGHANRENREVLLVSVSKG